MNGNIFPELAWFFIEETTQKQTYKNKQFHLLNFNFEIKRKKHVRFMSL